MIATCPACGYEGPPPHHCYGEAPPRTEARPARRERSQVSEEAITAAFTEAWAKCITEHDATLVSGPCDTCVAETGQRLRDAVTVWVYLDPESGVEIYETPSIGTRLEMPRDLHERFWVAQQAFETVSREVADLVTGAAAPAPSSPSATAPDEPASRPADAKGQEPA